MPESPCLETVENGEEYSRLLYKRHFQAAIVSCLATIGLWLTALAVFWLNIIAVSHFKGISLTVLGIILINPPILWGIKKAKTTRTLNGVSLLHSVLEVVGYTAAIHFLGGIEAVFLTPLYAILITYVGVFAPKGIPALLAFFSSLAFTLLIVAEHYGFLVHHKLIPFYQLPFREQLIVCLVVSALLFILAYVSTYTSTLLRRNRIKLKARNEALEEKTVALEEKERALVAAYDELEKKVEERTAELRDANKQLEAEIVVRQEAEKVLKESEEKYRLHFENIEDVLLSLDREMVIQMVSPSIEKALGYKPEELLGRSILEFTFFSPVSSFQAQEDMIRVFSGESITNTIYEFITKDGVKKYGELSGSPVIQGDQVIGLICVARDITERKQVEEALRRSEAFLKQTQEISKVGGWEYDVTAGRLSWTEEVRRIHEVSLDYDPNNIQQDIDFYAPQDRSIIAEAFWKAVKEGQSYDLELRLITAKGEEKWVRTTGQAERLEGKTIRVFGNIIDISDVKLMEEKRLVVSKLESTGILAGGIAHDFNNLLSAIIGNLQLIVMEVKPDEDTTRAFQEIEKAVWRARDLTKQLITFASGGDPIIRTTILPDLIKEEVNFSLSGSNEETAFFFPTDLWAVMADGLQLKQVVRNIILNAREAMPGGGKISVEAENLSIGEASGLPLPPNNYVKLSFTDRGEGIPEAILSKIFDPYFSTRQRGTQKGMGLGLTICHSIVNKHGGAITIDSQIGKGTTFHIYLPAMVGSAVEKHLPTGPAVRKRRILIMDDEEMMRHMVREVLKKLGYEIVSTENGQEAIDLYREAWNKGHPFDAVLLDLTVKGGMGGKEAIPELLKIDPSVKAVVCSGYDNDPVMANFQEYGFKSALIKPFLVENLKEILSKII
jgi:PAS domain S-box-containing protein